MKKRYKAEFSIGKVKRTRNQKKKHITQMTKEEVDYLKKQIKLFPTWKVKPSKHLKKKPITLNMDDIQDTLLARNVEDYIIEYNETKHPSGNIDRRLLIRASKPRVVKFKTEQKKKMETLAHLCFVISLDRYEIVTAFWNIVSDRHKTINWKRYNRRLRIIS